MIITVVVCTYNRCRSLPTALESIADQKLPPSLDWEVIVVDNNSGDQTRAVIEDFCRKYPGCFRYVFEPLQGLSRARNAGIKAARGEVIAFTDDDVTVDPNWLQNLTASLRQGEWSGAGGRVLPERSFSLPSWISRNGRYDLAPLALFDIGEKESELEEPPFGANMAYRKSMFEKYGTFRTDLGRSGNSLLSNEDTEFGGRLMAAGERLHFEPSAIVYHPVPEDRLKKEYFLAWWYSKARADVRLNGAADQEHLCISGIPLYSFRRLMVWLARWTIALSPAKRFSYKIKVWSVLGQITEFHQLSQGPK